MPATNRSRLDSNILTLVLEDRYGVGPLAADPLTVEWAVGHALNTYAPDTVKTALRRLNTARSSMGKMTVSLPYGHPLF